jgi:hypothetical protein
MQIESRSPTYHEYDTMNRVTAVRAEGSRAPETVRPSSFHQTRSSVAAGAILGPVRW